MLTLPSKNYKDEGGMKVKVYDPTGEHCKRWGRCGRLQDFQEVGEDLAKEGHAQEFLVGPFSILIFANPLPHSVTRIMAGERVSVVAFLGPEY